MSPKGRFRSNSWVESGLYPMCNCALRYFDLYVERGRYSYLCVSPLREEKLNKEKGEILAKQKREKKLLLEELGKPKKPMTTFFLYMQEQKALKNRTATGVCTFFGAFVVKLGKQKPVSFLIKVFANY